MPNLPEEAVEAAVNARGRANNPKWDDPIFGYQTFSQDQKDFLREEARTILGAAYHFLAAYVLEQEALTWDPDDYVEGYRKLSVREYLLEAAKLEREGPFNA